jgi:hypothetical protein
MTTRKWAGAAVVSLAACFADAATVELAYHGVSGGSSAAHVRVGGTTYYGGHMVHEFVSGPRAGQVMMTFCIDVGEAAKTGVSTYEIINLADAPIPGAPYGQARADAVSAVVANAIALGWIDAKLQADTSQAGYLAKMGAIQAAIWEALGFDVQVSAAQTTAAVGNYYQLLMANFDATLRTAGLRAIAAPGQQDMLYIVPLPPAAFAGAGVLCLGFGVRTLRRR